MNWLKRLFGRGNDEEYDETAAIARRFEWSVRALFQPVHVQENLFPDFVCLAEALALEFEGWRNPFLESDARKTLTTRQLGLIKELDVQLESMSGEGNEALWTDEALAFAPEWAKVRERALALAAEMNWNSAPPPIDRGDKWAQI
ncbi:MAG TPA: hypothetical protein VG734_18115 [Lacunisphaera sp.]|nr:hypothetical protein [Lacunisphaera sp.]